MGYKLCFYSNWDDVSSPKTFLREYISPDVLNYGVKYGNIKWSRTDIVGNTIDVEVYGNETLEKKEKKVTPNIALFSLLKSNLQKQVRLGHLEAVTTAAMMWELNQFELLRRIPIIAFEDSMPTVELMTVVWMMAVSSKGFNMPNKYRDWLLKYIRGLVLEPKCLYLDLPRNKRFKSQFLMSCISPMDTQKEFILAMLLRCSYGGLNHDPDMIMGVMYSHRIEYHKLFSELMNKPKDMKNVELPPFTILSSSVDYHCYPKIITLIKDAFKNTDATLIKKSIWECSSATNCRKERQIDKIYIAVWNEIYEKVYSLTYAYITYVFEDNKAFISKWYKKTYNTEGQNNSKEQINTEG